MQEPTFLILSVLAAGPQHGYGLMRQVAVVSDDRVHLRPGSLYATLSRLVDEGLIEVEREEVVDARLRRYYRITETGAKDLADAIERLRRNATIAVRNLRHGGFGEVFA